MTRPHGTQGPPLSPEGHSAEPGSKAGKDPWKQAGLLGQAPTSPGDKAFEYRKGLVPGKFCLISSSKVAKFSLIVVLSREVR